MLFTTWNGTRRLAIRVAAPLCCMMLVVPVHLATPSFPCT